MIQVQSSQKLEQIESALSMAAQRHGARLVAVIPLGTLMRADARKTPIEAISFAVCHTDIYDSLLAADVRFAAFLPCRVAAIKEGEGVTLTSVSPSLFPKHLDRPDLEQLTKPLEDLLTQVMQDVSMPASAGHAAHGTGDGALGADETQMSTRGSIPQRIDGRGTKVEDLAGTGHQDAPGG